MRDLVVIGTSAGGVEALRVIAGALPADLPAAVLIVMHLSPRSPFLLPEILRRAGPLDAREAVNGAPIEPGTIHVAPPDHHLLVKGNHISVVRGPKENHARPAIDPLFRTAAVHYGSRVVGVILTGMLDDGTAGLAAVKERGGVAVVQEPRDALYRSMPSSALRHVACDHTARLGDLASVIARVVREPAKRAEPSPVSRVMDIESTFPEMESPSMDKLDAIGVRAGLTCPECHGPVWKINDPALDRFRCLVGHAYTAHAIMDAQVESQESYLWQALRLMKERASLTFEMMAREQDRESGLEPAADVAQLGRLQRNIAAIQGMLDENGFSGAEALPQG